MNNFIEAMKVVRDSETKGHAWFIYGLVRWLRPKIAVEIGSFHGYTSCFIAKALMDNRQGILYCVDNFSLEDASAQKLRDNLEGVGVSKVVNIVEADSDKALLPANIDFAFVDGEHTFEGCKRDVLNMLKRGAQCVAVHDTAAWWGPFEWLEEFRDEFGEAFDILESDISEGLTVIKKRNPFKDKPAYGRAQFPSGDFA